MVKILIEIRGGCLQSVSSNEAIKYKLIDWDNIEDGDQVPETFGREDILLSEEEINTKYLN